MPAVPAEVSPQHLGLGIWLHLQRVPSGGCGKEECRLHASFGGTKVDKHASHCLSAWLGLEMKGVGYLLSARVSTYLCNC